MRLILIFLFITSFCFGQKVTYDVSFNNAVHHEAKIKSNFPNVPTDTLKVQMSRSSPGRYALHEFAKNVYGLKATDSKGNQLKITRKDPYSWYISGHDGTVNIDYILFANRADGTYSQIDETHAHLNIPATFIYSEALQERPIEVNFDLETQPDWKVATQLKEVDKNTFFAPDLYYFMDSPIEVSDYDLREFEMDGQTVRFVLHHPGTDEEFDKYFEQVKKIVAQEKAVFGELPKFDFGQYTFLGDYMPNVSGDGMEHRNSTVLTDVEALGEGGMKGNIGTVSHEFFHAWNVERIRPKSLEPFEFSEANMSGALWFAEGFTSYYTNLILARAGIISSEEYVKSLNGTFNYVWNSPAREFFNPIEMSYQAPFVDAATSVDPVNRENTFISYYSYGSVLGLALDLKLREKGLNLDNFMKLVWQKYGKQEKPYEIEDLEQTLAEYAGKAFASDFFDNYIYDSKMPNYKDLFASVGLKLERDPQKAFFGASLMDTSDGVGISRNVARNTPAYEAGLNQGDFIVSVDDTQLNNEEQFEEILKSKKPGDQLQLEIKRYNDTFTKEVKLTSDPAYTIRIDEKAPAKAVKAREAWLSKK